MTPEEVIALLQDTGHHHHQAFMDAEGVDPEWAMWYAAYMQSKIWDSFGSIPTRSSLVHILVEADHRFNADDSVSDWQPFYADFIVESLSTSK